MHDWRYDFRPGTRDDLTKLTKWRREEGELRLSSPPTPRQAWQILLLFILIAVLIGVLMDPPIFF